MMLIGILLGLIAAERRIRFVLAVLPVPPDSLHLLCRLRRICHVRPRKNSNGDLGQDCLSLSPPRGGANVRSMALVLCVAGLPLAMAASPSEAAEPELLLPGPGGSPADLDREVLWLDNPDFDASVGSSEVIGAFELWTEIAAAFLFDADAAVRKITWWGAYWNGYGGTPTGSGFNLRFYMMAADCLPEDAPFLEYLLAGDDCCEDLADGGDMYSQFVYAHCFDLPLPAGCYWYSAQMADHPFPPQWGRQGADWNLQICESAFRSPYFSYPDWEHCDQGIFEPWWASQMIEDVCESTPVGQRSWGAVKGLYR